MSYGKKQKIEGGQGGKRGHSNMNHWEHTEIIKSQTKRIRRRQSKKLEKDYLSGEEKE